MTEELASRQSWFSDSPFGNTASPQSSRCWAGQGKVLIQLRRLTRSLANRPDSTLDIVWANLGAGKSHALYHLAHMLDADGLPCRPRSAFVDMPEQMRGFLDLYRRIVAGMPLPLIAESVASNPGLAIQDSVRRACNVLLLGDSNQRGVVQDWLLAGRPRIPDLRKFAGISQRIESDPAAVDVLCDLILALGACKIRFVLLLDEFQRISVLKPALRDGVLSSLRSVFSRSPHYFSVVLSIMSRLQQTAMDLVPAELKTLIFRAPIALPAMTVDEAVEFVAGRFLCYRPCDYTGSATGPFEVDAIRDICHYVETAPNGRLGPRDVLQALSFVYDDWSESPNGLITGQRASEVLKLNTPTE